MPVIVNVLGPTLVVCDNEKNDSQSLLFVGDDDICATFCVTLYMYWSLCQTHAPNWKRIIIVANNLTT